MRETLWQNNPIFVNDIPTIKYMRKFLYSCHNSSRGKNRRQYFRAAPPIVNSRAVLYDTDYGCCIVIVIIVVVYVFAYPL